MYDCNFKSPLNNKVFSDIDIFYLPIFNILNVYKIPNCLELYLKNVSQQ